MGNIFFLYPSSAEGGRDGREYPRSTPDTRMAMNGTRFETAIVAANLIH
jgi:hypothetical protein